jgi:3-hydroxyacyl-CoA dehydrogenase
MSADSPSGGAIRLERDGAVAVIIVDNPPVNAGSWDVRNGIVEALGQITNDPDVTAAVLIGAGTTFIAGADIKEFGKPLRDPQMPAVVAALEACPKPVVAAIDGASLGGGFEVALGCDARVATKTSVVGLPEVHLGIIPGAGGTQRVPRLVGVARAIELISSGRRVRADEAAKLGLIDAVAEGDLRAFAVAHALSLGGRKRRVRDQAIPADATGAVDATAQAAQKTTKRNPAIAEAIKIVRRAAELSIDEGLTEERVVFQRLRVSETAAAARHLFFAERAAGRVSGTENVKPKAVATVGVVGGGTMGAGIAVAFSDAGFPVTLIERNKDEVQAAMGRVRATYDRLVSSGRISADEAQKRAGRITGSDDYATLSRIDLVVEAVFEDLAVKREVFSKLDNVLKPGAILGSNTSYLDLDMLGATTTRPQDVVGLHFFAPANVMRLLEVVRTKATSSETLATALAIAKKIRKVPVVARVCEGFIANRIYAAYRRECEILLEEGAYPEQVDAALEAFGFPMGPFAATDLSGLDIAWRTRKRLAATRDPRERYVPILDRLCEMGRLGRKAGAGWYTYAADAKRGTVDAKVHAVVDEVSRKKNITRRAFALEQIQARVLGAIVNEAALVLEDGIAERAGDIDLVLVNGYGFPADRGGPLFWASRRPRAELDRMIDDVASDIGFGFRRADLDRALAGLNP